MQHASTIACARADEIPPQLLAFFGNGLFFAVASKLVNYADTVHAHPINPVNVRILHIVIQFPNIGTSVNNWFGWLLFSHVTIWPHIHCHSTSFNSPLLIRSNANSGLHARTHARTHMELTALHSLASCAAASIIHMAAPIHPAIGRTYGAACDEWLLRPSNTDPDLVIPSREVMQQFDSTINRPDGVDPAKFETLWTKRTEVQDKLRIEELKVRPLPRLYLTDYALFYRSFKAQQQHDASPTFLQTHRFMCEWIQQHHPDFHRWPIFDQTHRSYDESALNRALAEWERNVPDMRFQIFMHLGLYEDIEDLWRAMQRVLSTHYAWINASTLFTLLMFHPATDRRREIESLALRDYLRGARDAFGATLRICGSFRLWGYRVPVLCLSKMVCVFDDANPDTPRWARDSALDWLDNLFGVQILTPHEAELYMDAVARCGVPIGYEATTMDEFNSFVKPLFLRFLCSDRARLKVALRIITMGGSAIGQEFMDRLMELIRNEEDRACLINVRSKCMLMCDLQSSRSKFKAQRIKPEPPIKRTEEESLARDLCIMCKVHARSFCFVPCGHLLACSKCAPSSIGKTCPVCNSHIAHLQHIQF